MRLFLSNKFFLIPVFLTLLVLLAIYLFPQIFSAQVVAIIYMFFGIIVVSTITRMSQKKLKEKNQIAVDLAQQKRYLENLIESAPEGIVWVDRHNIIKYINPKFVDIFGYTFEEAKGKDVDDLVSNDSMLEEAKEISAAVSKGITRQFEAVRFRKDGTPVHVSIIGAPMTSLRGHLEIFGIYRDISKEKLAEQKLIDSELSLRTISDQLRNANNLKELLLDIITHDLRNPAGVISGAIELLEDEFPNHDVLDVIRKSSNNLFKVIESASTLSKMSMGESIQVEPLDIIPILKEVAQSFESQLKSANMKLTLDLPDSLTLKANRIIREVISNYISNGIKYASSGKTLHLTTVTTPEFVRIELQDWGHTIPEHERTRIFERKIQLLDGPRKGSGLGLAIVKRIADAHDAGVGVMENDPTGNIFYFSFKKSPNLSSMVIQAASE